MPTLGYIFTNGKFQGIDNLGRVVSYGKLYIEDINGNPVTTYRDSQLTSANTSPIILSESGKADVYLKDGFYNITLTDSNGATIWTINNYVAGNSYSSKWRDDFVADGINDFVTASNDATDADVYLNGVLKVKGTDYTVSGKTITFTTLPAAGTTIAVIGDAFTSDLIISASPTAGAIPLADDDGHLNAWVNQGDGSGLDADTLDSYQGSDYLRIDSTTNTIDVKTAKMENVANPTTGTDACNYQTAISLNSGATPIDSLVNKDILDDEDEFIIADSADNYTNKKIKSWQRKAPEIINIDGKDITNTLYSNTEYTFMIKDYDSTKNYIITPTSGTIGSINLDGTFIYTTPTITEKTTVILSIYYTYNNIISQTNSYIFEVLLFEYDQLILNDDFNANQYLEVGFDTSTYTATQDNAIYIENIIPQGTLETEWAQVTGTNIIYKPRLLDIDTTNTTATELYTTTETFTVGQPVILITSDGNMIEGVLGTVTIGTTYTTADITSFGLSAPPVKAYSDDKVRVNIDMELDEDRILSIDTPLFYVSSTTTTATGKSLTYFNSIDGDDIILDGNVVATTTATSSSVEVWWNKPSKQNLYATSTQGDIAGWGTYGTSLPEAVSNAQAVVTNGYVYLLGGSSSSAVYYAPINSDGTLGTWATGASLPVEIYSSQAVVTNGYVYLLGGYSSSAVYYAPINSDGTLGTWATGASLPVDVGYAQAVVTSEYVYLLGGVTGGTIVSTVYYAPINSDGTLGAWATGTSLPAVVRYAQAIVTNGYVYLLGGSSSSTVYYAPINSDGTLGAWATGTSLPGVVNNAQAVVTSGYVYLLGGDNGSSYLSSVYYAPINSDGTLGTWATGTSLPGVLSLSQAVVTNNYVYLLGGFVALATSTALIYYSSFTDGWEIDSNNYQRNESTYNFTFAAQTTAPTTVSLKDNSTEISLSSTAYDNTNDNFKAEYDIYNKDGMFIQRKVTADKLGTQIITPFQSQLWKKQ